MPSLLQPAICTDLGDSIPNADHAVSVSLPTWKSNVGYEEGQEWVIGKMKNGYPRFFVNLRIRAFAEALCSKYGRDGEQATLFPTTTTARQCVDFMQSRARADAASEFTNGVREAIESIRTIDLVPTKQNASVGPSNAASAVVSAVLYQKQHASYAKQFWQHSGEGVSSRRAEFFHKLFDEGHLVPRDSAEEVPVVVQPASKGPKRYQKDPLPGSPTSKSPTQSTHFHGQENNDYLQFVEERFGRNLGLSLAAQAKLAVRRRIAAPFTYDLELKDPAQRSSPEREVRDSKSLTEDDVYLYPTGMSAIFNSHRILRKARGELKSIMLGFPYVDTLKILEKFGAGAVFYDRGSESDLDDIERRCKEGEQFLGLFCEFPANPLLTTPNLERIQRLSSTFGFPVVLDETIGNFLNVDVLPSVDVVVNSLTKVFSGDANVMGGSLTLNPEGHWYREFKQVLATDYEDNMWPEDAVFMERNSRDFVSRNDRINANAEAISDVLKDSPFVKTVYYPKYVATRPHYDAFKYASGGYGGLLSIDFHSMQDAQVFFDALRTEKGPSLGTNFTLSCPFIILAHYTELDWAASCGAEASLIRFSVGLEETQKLCSVFEDALEAIRLSKQA